MSDLTWTEMPEVNPEQPDELVLDFSGEIYRVAPADAFVIGRAGAAPAKHDHSDSDLSHYGTSATTAGQYGASPRRRRP